MLFHTKKNDFCKSSKGIGLGGGDNSFSTLFCNINQSSLLPDPRVLWHAYWILAFTVHPAGGSFKYRMNITNYQSTAAAVEFEDRANVLQLRCLSFRGKS